VFSSPDKERWPALKLLAYLKNAEALAREMLAEIAAKITITPAKMGKRAETPRAAPGPAQMRAPYFRLGVELAAPKDAAEDPMGPSPEHSEPEGHTSNAQAQRPGEAGTAASIKIKLIKKTPRNR